MRSSSENIGNDPVLAQRDIYVCVPMCVRASVYKFEFKFETEQLITRTSPPVSYLVYLVSDSSVSYQILNEYSANNKWCISLLLLRVFFVLCCVHIIPMLHVISLPVFFSIALHKSGNLISTNGGYQSTSVITIGVINWPYSEQNVP